MVRELGLDGKPTATICLPKTPLYKRLSDLVKAEGKYPHRAVSLPPKRGKRGIGSRLVKVTCEDDTGCGIILRASATVCERIEGADCPACMAPLVVWWG